MNAKQSARLPSPSTNMSGSQITKFMTPPFSLYGPADPEHDVTPAGVLIAALRPLLTNPAKGIGRRE